MHRVHINTSALLAVIALAASPAVAQTQDGVIPLNPPRFGASAGGGSLYGGTYGGPGDTVPGAVVGPGAGHCIDTGPALGNFSGDHPECVVYVEEDTSVSNQLLGWPDAPTCMQNGILGVEIHPFNITIGDMLEACEYAEDGIASVCVETQKLCPFGSDGLFVYQTIPFQAHPDGIPTTDPNEYLPVCGMDYDVCLESDDGLCDDINGVPGGHVNETTLGASGEAGVNIAFDCANFTAIVNQWELLGLYDPKGSVYLGDDDVVFTVLHKCIVDGVPSC